MGVTPHKEQDGIWRLEGGGILGHPGWVLEIEVLAARDYPVLTLLTPRFLNERPQVYEELRQAGYTDLVFFLTQEIKCFQRQANNWETEPQDSLEELVQLMGDILASVPPDQLRAALTPEQLRSGLTPKELFAELTPEQLRAALMPEEPRVK